MISLPRIVDLTRHERKVIEFIAKSRYNNDRAAQIGDRRVQEDLAGFGWKRDLIGFAAEFAFAKALNVMPDFTTEPRSGGVDAYLHGNYIQKVDDYPYTLPKRLAVDVKGTTDPKGRLIAPTKGADKYQTDIFVLVYVNLPIDDTHARQLYLEPATATIKGWAWRDDLINPLSRISLTKRDSGDQVDTYVVGTSQLHTRITMDGSMNTERFPSIHEPQEDSLLDDLF